MKSIGGYFELEMDDYGTVYHDNSFAVNSGRNALELILRSLKIRKIFVPYYTCGVTLQPIEKLGIRYEFYELDKQFNPMIKSVRNNDWVLFVNYFGIFNFKIKSLLFHYKNLILDNSQAFFYKAAKNIPAFYSPRKFFGISDGGFATIDQNIDYNFEKDISYSRFSHLLKRADDFIELGYADFQLNDSKLDNLPIRKMSNLSNKLLKSINYKKVIEIRNQNFKFIHQYLKSDNELTDIIENAEIYGPMVYPYLKEGNSNVRSKLIQKKIYVAQYWPNVKDWVRSTNTQEYYLYKNLIPLPIDQRYRSFHMERIIKIIGKIK